MPNLTTIISVAGASFAASFVEAVEALTVVLAVDLARGWRPALTGAAAALVALALIVAILGPLMSVIPIRGLQFVVGVLTLLFGLRWLRKAILRAIGIIALARRGRRLRARNARTDRSGGAGARVRLGRRRDRVQDRAHGRDRGRVHRHRCRRWSRPSRTRKRRRSGRLRRGGGCGAAYIARSRACRKRA